MDHWLEEEGGFTCDNIRIKDIAILRYFGKLDHLRKESILGFSARI